MKGTKVSTHSNNITKMNISMNNRMFILLYIVYTYRYSCNAVPLFINDRK